MKKIISISVLSFLLVTSMPLGVHAQSTSFTTRLGFGSKNSTEVMRLQNFLINQGFLKAQPTGNYFSLTRNAVSAFQASQHITPTGYFGPLTLATANRIASSGQTNPVASTVSVNAVTSSYGGAAAALLANSKVISWKTSGYPVSAGVNINLLRKVSDSPVTYALVRTIAKDTLNDGEESWTPGPGENGSDLYIEVTCSGTYNFSQGCQFTGSPIRAN